MSSQSGICLELPNPKRKCFQRTVAGAHRILQIIVIIALGYQEMVKTNKKVSVTTKTKSSI
jgi:hypothetical protein